ncbi:ankyrin repeat domain-containing protein [Acidovorax sp. 106]|uniref:ankyrin repeat domain-containing protein n=1 Tax=Acidovorax sp. 106 TaxID=2135637 RepID=UPI000EAE1215|nr:ankyrin repeat domain-containing protein [Acidovorax sp. 106]RLJ37011.1 ankyrin repeat protein [Acidovorax sp. 106]
MSESRLHYTVYFASRVQAAAWAAEAQATAQLPLPDQARVLGTMLGLGEDAGVSFEFAGAAQLCAELAVLGPWNLLAAASWPPGLMERGAKLFGCEWHNGPKAEGLWLNGPKPVTRKQFEAAVRKLDPLEEVHQLLSKEHYGEVLNLVHHHGLDPNTVLYHRPLIVHLLTPQAGKASGVLPTDAIIALLQAGARPDPLALVTHMPSYTLPVFPLHCAARAFDIALMQTLVDAGVEVNAVDDEGRTPLMQLADATHYLGKPVTMAVQAAQWLLERGAAVNAVSHHGDSALAGGVHQALRDLLMAHGGQVIWPRYALECDAPEQQLHAISYHDHARLDALLAQAPPDEAHRHGLLGRAVDEGNLPALDRLWRPGDHALMCIDPMAESRLLAQCTTKHEGTDVATMRDLVQRSAPEAFPARDAAWLNAATSCLQDFSSRIVDRPVEMVDMLLALGVPAEPPADAQHTPLEAAIHAQSEAKVALLLAHGANPNRVLHHGGNTLHEAVEHKATGCIPLLLQAGADRTHCDRQGRTPLQLAVSKRNKAAQKLLAD